MIFDSSIYEIPIINNVVVYDEIDSTNNQAKIFTKDRCVNGTLVVADHQTLGRGRMGRSFSSPAGQGIYMSLILKPDINVNLISQITLLSALSISRALQKKYNINVNIKWPNDILLNNKKICGILTEFSNSFVIIGIGINVNNQFIDKSISDIASSIYLETSKLINREAFIMDIIKEFSELYYTFLDKKSLAFIVDEYNNVLANYNKDIYIIPYELTNALSNTYNLNNENLEICHCMGISPTGELICRHSDSKLELISYGEISIRNV